MKIFILIITLNGSTIDHIEFTSMAKCEAARAAWIEDQTGGYKSIICVEK